jgi:hypothetical protein
MPDLNVGLLLFIPIITSLILFLIYHTSLFVA